MEKDRASFRDELLGANSASNGPLEQLNQPASHGPQTNQEPKPPKEGYLELL